MCIYSQSSGHYSAFILTCPRRSVNAAWTLIVAVQAALPFWSHRQMASLPSWNEVYSRSVCCRQSNRVIVLISKTLDKMLLAAGPSTSVFCHNCAVRGCKEGPQANCPQNLASAHRMLRPRAQMALENNFDSFQYLMYKIYQKKPNLALKKIWGPSMI